MQVLVCSAGTQEEKASPETRVSGSMRQPVFPVLPGLGLDKLLIHVSRPPQTQTLENTGVQLQAQNTPSSNLPAQNSASPGKAESKPKPKDLFSQMETAVGYYNGGIDEVPAPLKKLAGNDIILLEIGMKDGSKLEVKAVTENGRIVEFRKLASGEGVDATVSVYGSEAAFREIIYSKDPLNVLVNSLNEGKLDIEARGLLKKGALLAVRGLV